MSASGSAPARRKWKYAEKAKEFHARHGFAPYVMVPSAALEADMHHPDLTADERLVAAVRRFSFGNLCDYAVDAMPRVDPGDPEPKPYGIVRLAELLKIPKSTLSEAGDRLEAQNRLRKDGDLLYANDNSQPTLWASLRGPQTNPEFRVDPSSDSPNYSAFKKSYLIENTEFSEKLILHQNKRDEMYAEARAEGAVVRQMERQILAAFRRDQRHRRGSDSTAESGGSPNAAPAEPGFDSSGTSSDSSRIQFETPDGVKTDSNPPVRGGRTQTAASGSFHEGADAGLLNLESLIQDRSAAAAPSMGTNRRPEAPAAPPPHSPSPAGKPSEEEAAEFHGDLSLVFHQANKQLPTGREATQTLVAVHPHQAEFLRWLKSPQSRFAGIRSPAGLPALCEQFHAWRSHAARAAPAPPDEGDGWLQRFREDLPRWNELTPEVQQFYRQKFPDECPEKEP